MNHEKKYDSMAAGRYSDYMKSAGHNATVCLAGLVVRPEYLYLECSPDRKVTDPETHRHFGLAETSVHLNTDKSHQSKQQSDPNFGCKFQNGTTQLKESHQYYYQVQGQMDLCATERQSPLLLSSTRPDGTLCN